MVALEELKPPIEIFLKTKIISQAGRVGEFGGSKMGLSGKTKTCLL